MVLEEGNRPYPRCPQGDMFVTHKALNGQHMMTTFCQRRSERKRRRLEEEEARAESDMAFTANGIPLSYVTSFKYIGQQLQVINYKTAYLTHMALMFGS